MTPHDRESFVNLITDVLAFYGKTVSMFAIGVWWEACRGFELSAIERALSRHAMDPERGRFAPLPGDLVAKLQGTPTDRAAKAWAQVIASASSVGAYTDVVFDDPIIHVVIEDLGGWPAICRTETEKLSYTQHRFTEAYRGYVNRGDLGQYPRKLIGDRSPDETFVARGMTPPKPVLVGNPARAQAVLAGGSSDPRLNVQSLDNAVDRAITALIDKQKDQAA